MAHLSNKFNTDIVYHSLSKQKNQVICEQYYQNLQNEITVWSFLQKHDKHVWIKLCLDSVKITRYVKTAQ